MLSHVSLSLRGHPKARPAWLYCQEQLPNVLFYVPHLRANTAQPRTEIHTQGRVATHQHQVSLEGWLSTALASFSMASILR